MNILVLTASPRKRGITSRLAESFVEGFWAAHDEREGADVFCRRQDSRDRPASRDEQVVHDAGSAHVEVVNVNALDFKPCRGCLYCRTHGNCCLPADGAHGIAERIRQCDALVVAAPVYWGNIPGNLKALFDRMVYVLMGESARGIPIPKNKGKLAYLMTACTTPFPFNVICSQSTGVFRALQEILGTAGFKTCGRLAVPGTKKMDALPECKQKKAYAMGRKLFLNLR